MLKGNIFMTFETSEENYGEAKFNVSKIKL